MGDILMYYFNLKLIYLAKILYIISYEGLNSLAISFNIFIKKV
jgi:hypothetical protein